MNLLRFAKCLFLITILTIHPAVGFCQEPPPGESGAAQAERFRIEAKAKEEKLQEKARTGGLEYEEKKEAAPSGKDVSFFLKEVKVSGATLFQSKDFEKIYGPSLGKEVRLSDLDRIARRIKAKYNEKGAYTTNVYLPEQDILAGAVEIRVLEGRMGDVVVEKNRWFSEKFFKKRIHVKKNEILNVRRIEKDILRLNRQSDVEVKAVLSPGKEPGMSDLVLQVKDRFPWHLGAGEDNQGSRLTGKYRASATLRSSNVSGLGDSLYTNSTISSHAFGEYASYQLPIGTHGTKAGFDYMFYKSILAREFRSFKIIGTTQMFQPYVTQELYLSETVELDGNAGIDIEIVKRNILGSQVSNDQLRIPYFGFDLSIDDRLGRTTFSPKFNFSTAGFLGASSGGRAGASRAGTGGFFFKYEQSIKRILRLFWGSYAILGSNFQIPTAALPNSERFSLGGFYSVRGYPEGDFLADTGFTFNYDWIFPLYGVPKSWKLPYSDTPLRRQLEPVAFLDLGYGRNRKVLDGEQQDKFLMGVGGGLRFRFRNNLSVRLEWAKAVGDKPLGGAGPSTFHLSVQAEI